MKIWSFCNVYLCINQQNWFLDKTNTQQTVAKVEKFCTEEKPSFLRICVSVCKLTKSQPKGCQALGGFPPKA